VLPIFGAIDLGKDKNPDDPLAASRFIQITKAYQALTEPWIDVFLYFFSPSKFMMPTSLGMRYMFFCKSNFEEWKNQDYQQETC